jgi:hypothetical protein
MPLAIRDPGLFALINGLISVGLMAVVALVTGAPFIFPSLEPTAFLLFYTPTQPAASPRNTIGGFREPWELFVLLLGVGLLVAQGIVINRLAGIDYPLWSCGRAVLKSA